MFEATSTFLFFDYFRVPYRVGADSAGAAPGPLSSFPSLRRQGERGRALTWVASDALAEVRPGAYTLDRVPVFVRLLPDAEVRSRLDSSRWTRRMTIRDLDGKDAGAVWQDVDGHLFLPFDPGEVMTSYWSEQYGQVGRSSALARLRRLATQLYYWLRPALPRPVQIAVRRVFRHLQSRSRFPSWPVETALHDFYGTMFGLATHVAEGPVPWIAPWPDGFSWALVLTHDVETAAGYAAVPRLREVESATGFRSSWNFVPKRYDVEDRVVAELREAGFEVGVHGLYHDGHDLAPGQLDKRLPVMRSYADRWAATGFRSPATLRDWGVMPLLGFDYDSSYPDTDPYEPQPGGCCTWLPFFNDGLVELPITLPQDHTLFVILREPDGRLWHEKAEHLRRQGGLALLVTHPDYLLDDPPLAAYRALLERYQHDATAWRALPSEVADWWRRRSRSTLEPHAGGWRITGPAASQGRISLASPPTVPFPSREPRVTAEQWS